MKKILIFCVLISCISFSFVMWTTYNYYSDPFWWWTMYGSDWSKITIRENTLKLNNSIKNYYNPVNPMLEKNKQIQYNKVSEILDKYDSLLDDYNKKKAYDLNNSCLNNTIKLVDEAWDNCVVYKNEFCSNSMLIAQKSIDAQWLIISKYGTKSSLFFKCEMAYELWKEKLKKIKSIIGNSDQYSNKSCEYWKYWNTKLQFCLDRPMYREWILNSYKWTDWKLYCNDGYVWDIDLGNCVENNYYDNYNSCPANSSPADNWVCYCDEWYINNETNDWCVLADYECGDNSYFNWENCSCKDWYYLNEKQDWCVSLKNYCKDAYWSNMGVGENEDWNEICMCNDWYYFNEISNSCKDYDRYCKYQFWKNASSEKDLDILNCVCDDWYEMINNSCVLNDDNILVRYESKKSNKTIKTISMYLDDKIDSKYKGDSENIDEVVEYRNDFIKTLEQFLDNDISKKESKKEFVKILWKLMPMIK